MYIKSPCSVCVMKSEAQYILVVHDLVVDSK